MRDTIVRPPLDQDHEALAAACEPGTALCTIVGIDGSFSRRLGAQLAIRADGSIVGSLADSCLERQLAADIRQVPGPVVVRYGRGSRNIDFRLPCGGGLDILLDPRPDRAACRAVIETVTDRRAAWLTLPAGSPLHGRAYLPGLRILAAGDGPELEAFARLARAASLQVETIRTRDRGLAGAASSLTVDRWTAVLLLFHDHEWERPLLASALASEAFYVGAQGGEAARIERTLQLTGMGLREEDIARIVSPIGAVRGCKSPTTLALSALAEIAGAYERLLDGA